MEVIDEPIKREIKRSASEDEIRILELRLLLEGLYRLYGYDFREYSMHSLRRRVESVMVDEGTNSLGTLQSLVFRDRYAWERLLLALTVNVTSMFRDPEFFLAFREKVLPELREEPFLRFWHAGCATGEEVYSMAILFKEEGMSERTRIYATDLNEAVLKQARNGIYSEEAMAIAAENYKLSGGAAEFNDYYMAKYGSAILKATLRDNVLFAQHNLVTDGSFNEFNVLFCRNVMIYFSKPLQDRVNRLLLASLAPGGFLCLGPKETLRFTSIEQDFEIVDEANRIYRRKLDSGVNAELELAA